MHQILVTADLKCISPRCRQSRTRGLRQPRGEQSRHHLRWLLKRNSCLAGPQKASDRDTGSACYAQALVMELVLQHNSVSQTSDPLRIAKGRSELNAYGTQKHHESSHAPLTHALLTHAQSNTHPQSNSLCQTFSNTSYVYTWHLAYRAQEQQ